MMKYSKFYDLLFIASIPMETHEAPTTKSVMYHNLIQSILRQKPTYKPVN